MGVIRFTKMQGLGNDYIYVNVMECPIINPEQFSIRWSDRRKGIGSDGLIMIGKSSIADFMASPALPISACAFSMLTDQRHACAETVPVV